MSESPPGLLELFLWSGGKLAFCPMSVFGEIRFDDEQIAIDIASMIAYEFFVHYFRLEMGISLETARERAKNKVLAMNREEMDTLANKILLLYFKNLLAEKNLIGSGLTSTPL